MLKKAALIAAAAIGGAFLAAAPALASNAGTTVHMSVPLVDAGLTLTCGTTVLTATGRDMREPLQTPCDAGNVAELLGEDQAFLEPRARALKVALLQSRVAQRVKDEFHSPFVLGVTVQCQSFFEDLQRPARLADAQ